MDFDKYQTRGAYHYQWYNSGEPDWYKKCVDRCLSFCSRNNIADYNNVLDVGCGDGLVSDLLYDNGFDVTGIDNDETAIQLAREHGQGVFRLEDINKPFKGRWELMVCLNVIEHLEDPEAIKRIFDRNITKAAIIITDMPQKNPSPYHVKEFTPYELKQMFHTRKVVPFKIDDNFHGIEVYK